MPTLTARPSTLLDAPALAALAARVDTHWFGAPESDELEAREGLERIDDLATQSRLLLDGDDVVGSASVWGQAEGTLVLDPGLDPAAAHAAYRDLLSWLAFVGAEQVEALREDTVRLSVLSELGWRTDVSDFELARDPRGLPEPSWPAGVTTTGLEPGEVGPVVHALVYEQAGWVEVPGHVARPCEQWLQLLRHDGFDPEQQVLAWRGNRLVGVAWGRTFSDGMGWVSQLAVARAERGQGLGRALLLRALQLRVSGGASRLGLGVVAGNTRALGLYLAVGLTVQREWVRHRRD